MVQMMESSEDSSSAEDYEMFADLLNMDSSTNRAPPTKAEEPSSVTKTDVEKDSYAEFSELLGVENEESSSKESKKTVSKVAIKKIEIDPEDYNIFDSLLQRSGGTGKKPVKGSQRYIRKASIATPARPSEPRPTVSTDADQTSDIPPPAPKRPIFLTKEETAEAYAVMREEFGAGMHSDVEQWLPDAEVTSLEEIEPAVVEEKPIILQKPPTRPGALSGSALKVETTDGFYGGEDVPPAEPEPEPEPVVVAPLQPKPTMPGTAFAIDDRIGAKANEVGVQNSISEPIAESEKSPPVVVPLQAKPTIPGKDTEMNLVQASTKSETTTDEEAYKGQKRVDPLFVPTPPVLSSKPKRAQVSAPSKQSLSPSTMPVPAETGFETVPIVDTPPLPLHKPPVRSNELQASAPSKETLSPTPMFAPTESGFASATIVDTPIPLHERPSRAKGPSDVTKQSFNDTADVQKDSDLRSTKPAIQMRWDAISALVLQDPKIISSKE